MSRSTVLTSLALALTFGGFEFAHGVHWIGPASHTGPPAVPAPPDDRATLVQRSDAELSAYSDAWSVVRSVGECKQHGGTLPTSVHQQSDSVRMVCGGGVLTQYLHSGNRVTYRRVTATRYQVAVTAADGEQVRYDSRSGRFTPPQ